MYTINQLLNSRGDDFNRSNAGSDLFSAPLGRNACGYSSSIPELFVSDLARITSGVDMARQAAYVSPAYVLDIDDDDWRIIVPIYGKLNPYKHNISFGTRGEAEEWLTGAEGQSMVSRLQSRAPASQ